jgi:hypothetical protein
MWHLRRASGLGVLHALWLAGVDALAMSGRRQKRDVRRAGVKIKPTPRDVALLRALGKFRIAKTHHLGQLFFFGRNRDVVASRLRRLFDAGFLETKVLERAGENIYWLGPKGRDVVRASGLIPQSPPRAGWHHHLAVVEAWSATASDAHRGKELSLRRFVPEWQVREENLVPGHPVVPDGLVELRLSGGDVPRALHLALEVDAGTESLPVLRRKFQAYEDLHLAGIPALGWPSFVVLVALIPSAKKRAAAITELLGPAPSSFARVWTIGDELLPILRSFVSSSGTPSTTSRCGNGRSDAASPTASSGESETGAGLSDEE